MARAIMSAPKIPTTQLTVLEMVHSALMAGGFDGLYNTSNDCACYLGNLNPCDSMMDDCIAGHLMPCLCGNVCGCHIGQTPSDGGKP